MIQDRSHGDCDVMWTSLFSPRQNRQQEEDRTLSQASNPSWGPDVIIPLRSSDIIRRGLDIPWQEGREEGPGYTIVGKMVVWNFEDGERISPWFDYKVWLTPARSWLLLRTPGRLAPVARSSHWQCHFECRWNSAYFFRLQHKPIFQYSHAQERHFKSG